MALSRTALTVGMSAAAVVLIVAGLIVGLSNDADLNESSAIPPVVKTDFPGLTAPTGDAQLPALASLAPVVGTVERADGPFDDRFQVNDLVFDGVAVAGSIVITSDVSEVINLEVVAGFYDSSGAMIGENRFVLDPVDGHESTGPPDESIAFRIAVPTEIAGRAVSAAIGVPVLVNE